MKKPVFFMAVCLVAVSLLQTKAAEILFEDNFESYPVSTAVSALGKWDAILPYASGSTLNIENDDASGNKVLSTTSGNSVILRKNTVNLTGDFTINLDIKLGGANADQWLYIIPSDKAGDERGLDNSFLTLNISSQNIRFGIGSVVDVMSLNEWHNFKICGMNFGTTKSRIRLYHNGTLISENSTGAWGGNVKFSDARLMLVTGCYSATPNRIDNISITPDLSSEKSEEFILNDTFEAQSEGSYQESDPLPLWDEMWGDTTNLWTIAKETNDPSNQILTVKNATQYIKRTIDTVKKDTVIEFKMKFDGAVNELSAFLQTQSPKPIPDNTKRILYCQSVSDTVIDILDSNAVKRAEVDKGSWHKIRMYLKDFGTNNAKITAYLDETFIFSQNWSVSQPYNSPLYAKSHFVMKASSTDTSASVDLDDVKIYYPVKYDFSVKTPSVNSKIATRKPVISGVGSENAQIDIVLDGIIIGTATVENSKWHWNTPTALASGSHTILVTETENGIVSQPVTFVFQVEGIGDLAVADARFTYSGTEAKNLQSNGILSGQIALGVDSVTVNEVSCVIALYNSNNRLTKILFDKVTVDQTGVIYSQELQTQLPQNVGGYKVKVFVFDNLNKISPAIFENADITKELN